MSVRDPPVGRITISELFPLYRNAYKWGSLTRQEQVRLQKEYTTHTRRKNCELYKIDDFFHRDDGPAITMYDGDNVWFEIWSTFGIKTQEIEYDENNKMIKFWRL